MLVLQFMKSYVTDFTAFKQRYTDAGLGNEMDATVSWQNLLGSNSYLKKDELKKLKNNSVQLRDLNSLKFLIKSSIILLKHKEGCNNGKE